MDRIKMVEAVETVEELLWEATLVQWGACTHMPRYLVYLLYWYKGTHTW